VAPLDLTDAAFARVVFAQPSPRYEVRGEGGDVATEEDLRAIALSLPSVEERSSYGKRPSWRVAGHGFVGIWKDEASAVFVAEDTDKKQALLAESSEKFFTTAHYGESARLLVRLSAVDVDELRQLITESWRQAAPPELLQQFDGK
jgi:hypothetical protein